MVLVHLSDCSWSIPGEEAIRNFKKGDEVEAVFWLSIPKKSESPSASKQLDGDPYTSFIATHEKNAIVNGVVKSVDAPWRDRYPRRRDGRLSPCLRGVA